MLKQKIRISTDNTDANLSIYFQSSNNLGGLSEDIDNLVTDQTNASINDTSDGEKNRFTPLPSSNYNLTALFYKINTATYVSNVAPNEFAASAVTSSSFLNSFYVYKIFDTPFENTQQLIHTGYLNGFNFNGYSSAAYKWNNSFEYADIHVPNSFLSTITGNTFNLYMKLNFYSANSGHVYPFSGITTTHIETDLYNTLTFTASTRYYIVSPFTFKEIKQSAYVDIINESVQSVNIEKPIFPTGNTFTIDGTYINL